MGPFNPFFPMYNRRTGMPLYPMGYGPMMGPMGQMPPGSMGNSNFGNGQIPQGSMGNANLGNMNPGMQMNNQNINATNQILNNSPNSYQYQYPNINTQNGLNLSPQYNVQNNSFN